MSNQSPVAFEPTRLCVLVRESSNDSPIGGLPLFAEVLWPAPPPAPDRRFFDAWRRAITIVDEDCANSDSCTEASGEALAVVLSRVLPPAVRDELAQRAFVEQVQVLKRVAELAVAPVEGMTFGGLSSHQLVQVIQPALAATAAEFGLPTNPEPSGEAVLRYPLGVLATDAVGYASYDLTRLPKSVTVALIDRMDDLACTNRPDDLLAPVDLMIHAFGGGGPFTVLGQRRFMSDAIVARIRIDRPTIPPDIRHLGLSSMQGASIVDWKVSSASIASTATAMIGADGCETLLPAHTAIEEYSFYQVFGISDELAQPPTQPVNDELGVLQAALVNEHRLSWIPIGHSLGQIVQTFPLAPGEAIKIAVIDWTRRDSSLRKEDTKIDESLVHELRRDRMISETVRASIDEWQRGGSIIGGIASAAGGAMAGSGYGGAIGITNALGGGYSTSSGTRNIAADTNQRLSDAVTQTSVASRELFSTTVVQTSQAENEAIETRVIANYNHSHTLTILYYEILRQFRLVSEFTRSRPALLVKMKTDLFNSADMNTNLANVVKYRPIVEAVILNQRHIAGFDAIERLRQRSDAVGDISQPLPNLVAPPPPEMLFKYFTFEIMTGGMVTNSADDDNWTDIYSWILGTPDGHCQLVNVNGYHVLAPRGIFSFADCVRRFTAKVEWTRGDGSVHDRIPWSAFDAMAVRVANHPGDDNGSDLAIRFIKVFGTTDSGAKELLIDQSYEDGALRIGSNDNEVNRNLIYPCRRQPATQQPAYREEDLRDRADATALMSHLADNSMYYIRAVHLNFDVTARAKLLSMIRLDDGTTALDHVANEPLEVLGDYLALPCIEPEWSKAILGAAEAEDDLPAGGARFAKPVPVERLVSLPSRGVFAEAKLGHCNVSEEIDQTRFWDWQQSPLPLTPADIATIQAATPQYQVPQGIEATTLPAPVVSIVNPPPAPDPTGMAAVLTALTSANVFRDMSGRAEVADLLKKLSDNSVEIARVAQQTMSGGQRPPNAGGAPGPGTFGGASMPGAGLGGTPASRSPLLGSSRAAPTEPSTATQDLHDFQHVLKRAEEKGLLSPAAAETAYAKAVTEATSNIPLENAGYGISSGHKPYVYFFFVKTGTSKVVGAPLGINPNNAMNNAVDIRAHASSNLTSLMHDEFRFRQVVEQRSWQLAGGVWSLVYSTNGPEDDHPGPGAQLLIPPDIAFYDSPGWPYLLPRSTRRLPLGGGNLNTDDARQVIVQMYFVTWVEGRFAPTTGPYMPLGFSPWVKVSSDLEWCSVQALYRSDPNADWQSTPQSILESGPAAKMGFWNPGEYHL